MGDALIAAVPIAVLLAAVFTHVLLVRGRLLRGCNGVGKGLFWLLYFALAILSSPVGFLFGGTLGGGIGALFGSMLGTFKAQITVLGIWLGIFITTFFISQTIAVLLGLLISKMSKRHADHSIN